MTERLHGQAQLAEGPAERQVVANLVKSKGGDPRLRPEGRSPGREPGRIAEFERVSGKPLTVGGNLLDLIARMPEYGAQVESDWSRALAGEEFVVSDRVGKGTGLGLSMVHGLTSQLGGALAIQSRPGRGTDIELWLPQSESRPAEPAHTSELDAAPRRGTALLVDDEELVRLSTAELLEDLGYDVLEAASAEAALQVVRTGVPLDLVVTDHLMPGMTGSDLARMVRVLRPRVPVLIISGYAESEGIEPDLPRLTKPFRRDELVASLASLGSWEASQIHSCACLMADVPEAEAAQPLASRRAPTGLAGSSG